MPLHSLADGPSSTEDSRDEDVGANIPVPVHGYRVVGDGSAEEGLLSRLHPDIVGATTLRSRANPVGKGLVTGRKRSGERRRAGRPDFGTVAAVRATDEREVKLAAGEGFELPELGGEPLERRVFVSTYHDTPDYRLARAGVTLRHRVENRRGLWQLKLPRVDSRLELEEGGEAARPPTALRRLLPGLTRGSKLVPVARLRTRRAGVRVQDNGSSLADVFLDSVSVLEGRRVARAFEEVEIELVDGDRSDLRRLTKALQRAGAGDEETRPKVVQALGLQLVETRPAADPATSADALRGMLALQLGRMLTHDPGTRHGDDPEDVHQLRVATRRLRAFLRAARPLLAPEWADGLRLELGWLARALGPVRDLDVMLGYLRDASELLEPEEQAQFAPLLKQLEQQRGRARAALTRALDGDRYLELLNRLEQAAETPHVTDEDHSLADLWAREWKRWRRAVRALESEPADAALHELRIKTKRARYAAELAASTLGKPGARFIEGAKNLQDVLGEHQDAFVLEERIRSLSAGSRSTGLHLAAGRMIERQRARRASARAEYARAVRKLERLGRSAAKA